MKGDIKGLVWKKEIKWSSLAMALFSNRKFQRIYIKLARTASELNKITRHIYISQIYLYVLSIETFEKKSKNVIYKSSIRTLKS